MGVSESYRLVKKKNETHFLRSRKTAISKLSKVSTHINLITKTSGLRITLGARKETEPFIYIYWYAHEVLVSGIRAIRVSKYLRLNFQFAQSEEVYSIERGNF
eukprot:COSAG03_NODE_4121_length_1677_cov_5.044482_1_plen_103_part_00